MSNHLKTRGHPLDTAYQLSRASLEQRERFGFVTAQLMADTTRAVLRLGRQERGGLYVEWLRQHLEEQGRAAA